MKNKLKSVAGNGLPWGLAFFCVAFLSGYYVFHMPAQKIVWLSAVIGFCALVANGIIYTRFTRPVKQLKTISIEIPNTEILLLEAPANHLTENSLVAGKLFLTTQRIIFKPHKSYKLAQSLFWWDLTDIEPAEFHGSIWNGGGEFLLNAKEQSSLMFEVDSLKQWKVALDDAQKK